MSSTQRAICPITCVFVEIFRKIPKWGGVFFNPKGGGGSSQMITVLQRGVLEHDYSVPRILGYYISNIISMDLTKNQASFLVGKN